jgi:hypothetical protein
MRAFEVRLNGKRLCVAGFEGGGVLNTIVNHISGHGRDAILDLRIGGLISATDEHVDWHYAKLSVGDEIAVKIVETNSADPPINRALADQKAIDRLAKARILEWAKKFGWKVTKRPSKSK